MKLAFEDLIDVLSDQMLYLKKKLLNKNELSNNEIKLYEISMARIFDFFNQKWRELIELGYEEYSLETEDGLEIPHKMFSLFKTLEKVGVVEEKVSEKIGDLILDGEKYSFSPMWCIRFSEKISKIIEELQKISEVMKNASKIEESKLPKSNNHSRYIIRDTLEGDIRQAIRKSGEFSQSARDGSELCQLEREGLDAYAFGRLVNDGGSSHSLQSNIQAEANREFYIQEYENESRGRRYGATGRRDGAISGILEGFIQEFEEFTARETKGYTRERSGERPDYVRKAEQRINSLSPEDKSLLEKGLVALYYNNPNQNIESLFKNFIIINNSETLMENYQKTRIKSLNSASNSFLSDEKKFLNTEGLLRKYIDALYLCGNVDLIENKELLSSLLEANIKEIIDASEKTSYSFVENTDENEKLKAKFKKSK